MLDCVSDRYRNDPRGGCFILLESRTGGSCSWGWWGLNGLQIYCRLGLFMLAFWLSSRLNWELDWYRWQMHSLCRTSPFALNDNSGYKTWLVIRKLHHILCIQVVPMDRQWGDWRTKSTFAWIVELVTLSTQDAAGACHCSILPTFVCPRNGRNSWAHRP